MTTLINQRYLTDCVIAAISMALDLPYEEVYAAAIESGEYKEDHLEGIRREENILTHLGLQGLTFKEGKGIGGDFRSKHKDYAISPEFFRNTFWGRPTIFSVPSLNKVGGHHAVYYDGYKVYDPNPPSRNRYEEDSFDELLPSEAVVFLPNITSILAMRRATKLAPAPQG
jgi:hypothetical protein